MNETVAQRRCPTCGDIELIRYGKSDNGRQRWRCKTCGRRTTTPTCAHPEPIFADEIPKKQIYVVTAAQNATPVHEGFWTALQEYCEVRDAALVVVPMRYKNPTSLMESQTYVNDFEWWDSKTVPFLFSGRARLHKKLMLLADFHINPTATRPLSGLDSITGSASGIVPHTKAEMRTIATPHHEFPKIMVTTGAVTVANYSQTKAGAKGEFHHVLGAIVVEIDGGIFHLRRINATLGGAFTDLWVKYRPDETTCLAPPADALVIGDTHFGRSDPKVLQATFDGPNSLIAKFHPKHLVWHDLLDFHSRMHWDEAKPFVNLAKQRAGKDNVLQEIRDVCAFVEKVDAACKWKPKHVFPFSNHPDAFARWMDRADWRQDPVNAEMYLETAFAMAKSTEWNQSGANVLDPFVYWAEKLLPPKILERCLFLGPNDSFSLHDIELGMHGHLGPNGARGSLMNLSKLGVKSITGHCHSPGEQDGAMSVGTSSVFFLGYNRGPSSWLQTHAVLHADGKRQLINIIHGKAWLE